MVGITSTADGQQPGAGTSFLLRRRAHGRKTPLMHRRALPFYLSTVTDGGSEGGDSPDGDVADGADDGQTVSLKTMQDRVARANASAERQQRELREKVAKLQKASDELDRLQDADKTEQQRLADELETVKRESAERDAENAQLRLAVDHGIGAEDRGLIGVGDPETLASRAARLGALLAAEKELAELKKAQEDPAKRGAAVIGRPVTGPWPGATAVSVVGKQSDAERGRAEAAKHWPGGVRRS